jgi:hypothetical protein
VSYNQQWRRRPPHAACIIAACPVFLKTIVSLSRLNTCGSSGGEAMYKYDVNVEFTAREGMHTF